MGGRGGGRGGVEKVGGGYGGGRRCTHKAEHTKGGLWPPQESCYLRGHRQGACTQKAVHTQGGTHKRRSVATAGVLLFKGPQARRCI